MRRLGLALVPVIGLLVGCDLAGGGSDPDDADFDLPPGFALLTASNVVDELATAMRQAGSVHYTVDVSMAGPAGATMIERSGAVRWHEAGVDIDKTWRMSGRDDTTMTLDGVATIVDGVAYLGGDWVLGLPAPADVSIRFEDNLDMPESQRDLVDETIRRAAPEVHLAIMSTTSRLRPVDVDEGGVGVWYEGLPRRLGSTPRI